MTQTARETLKHVHVSEILTKYYHNKLKTVNSIDNDKISNHSNMPGQR